MRFGSILLLLFALAGAFAAPFAGTTASAAGSRSIGAIEQRTSNAPVSKMHIAASPYTCQAARVCGGSCPTGLACQHLTADMCMCMPSPVTCGYDPRARKCGGTCPPGKSCKSAGSDRCSCS